MPILLDLFITFAKVGVLTFGGGYAMLPLLQKYVVTDKGWITEIEMTDCYAIGQCTPGVIAVNTATYVGYRQKGISGGIIATFGVVFPSLVIITIIAALLKNFADYQIVKDAFAGIRICVCVLIANTVIKLWKTAIIDKTAICIFIAAFSVSAFTSLSAVIIVIAAGIAGIVIKAIRKELTK